MFFCCPRSSTQVTTHRACGALPIDARIGNRKFPRGASISTSGASSFVVRGRSPEGYFLQVPEVQVIETVRSYLAAQRGIPAELLNRKYIVNIVALARGILWVRDA